MLRIIAWLVLLTFVPIVLIIFFFTHFGLMLWLALIVAVAAAIYGAVMNRPPRVTKTGPP